MSAPNRPDAPAPATSAPERTLTRLEQDAPPQKRALGRVLLLVPPRGVASSVALDPDEPVVRFDALQSAIGALTIRGADRVAWEDVDDGSGVVAQNRAATGDDPPRPGNRPLIEVSDGTVRVALRHVRLVRRLLIDAPADTAVTVEAQLGGTVRSADPEHRARISVVVVDGRLEVRTEYGLPEGWRDALAAMGWSPLASVPR